jgi:hypothetical protein
MLNHALDNPIVSNDYTAHPDSPALSFALGANDQAACIVSCRVMESARMLTGGPEVAARLLGNQSVLGTRQMFMYLRHYFGPPPLPPQAPYTRHVNCSIYGRLHGDGFDVGDSDGKTVSMSAKRILQEDPFMEGRSYEKRKAPN